jgi:polysaccharide biosynthesis protein PslH
MKILFVVPYAPNRIRVRPFELLLSLLRRGHEVTVATAWTCKQELDDLRVLSDGGARVVAARLHSVRSAWNCFSRICASAPLQASYCWQPSLARQICSLIADESFDVVHVEHLRGARYGLMAKSCLVEAHNRKKAFAGPHIPVVWDSVDCIGRLFRQAADASRSLKGRLMAHVDLKRTERFEALLVDTFDRVLVTSPDDRDSLHRQSARFAPSAAAEGKIDVIPNGVDLDFFRPLEVPRSEATLIFSGKMSYHANASAADYLVKEILPAVWSKRPEVRLMIVGKDPARQVRALARNGIGNRNGGNGRTFGPVTVTGTVDDVRPFLCQAAVAVVPLLYGAGIQNKVLEAMACGTPVVLSEQATSALRLRPGYEAEVARTSGEFSKKILELLECPDKRADISQAGRRYVETHHSWDAAAQKLESSYWRAIEKLNGRTKLPFRVPKQRTQARAGTGIGTH